LRHGVHVRVVRCDPLDRRALPRLPGRAHALAAAPAWPRQPACGANHGRQSLRRRRAGEPVEPQSPVVSRRLPAAVHRPSARRGAAAFRAGGAVRNGAGGRGRGLYAGRCQGAHQARCGADAAARWHRRRAAPARRPGAGDDATAVIRPLIPDDAQRRSGTQRTVLVLGPGSARRRASAGMTTVARLRRQSMTRTGFTSGSFDPVTNGHLDVIGRAARMVDRLVIGIGVHPGKTPLFSTDEKIDMLKAETAGIAKAAGITVDIVTFGNLTVDAARAAGATLIFRGLRDGTDFD